MGARIQPEIKDLQFSFSFFRNLWSKDSTVITLHDLYLQVVSPLWKPQTECYRKLKDRTDRDNEAKMLKDSMPIVIAEGICRPNHSHAAANLTGLSLLAMYDLDHSNERTPAIKELFRQLPYVAYAHTSISGEGLKVFVYLDARTPEEYPLAYAICQQTLERITQHPCDPQCARITQPCSCVWDPDAYFNPSPTPYPWREELATDPSLKSLVQTANNFPNNQSTYTYLPTGNGKVSPIPPASEACGYIENFIRSFTQYHSLQKGNRHESMLAMGRSARRKGFSKEEIESLISKMTVRIVNDSYSLQELRKDLYAGYQYVDLSYTPQKDDFSALSLSTVTYRGISPVNDSATEDDMSIKDEELRSSTPFISNEIYQHLPDLINEALKPARNPRAKDMLLLGILANLSGCMPQVSLLYDQCPYSPHLFILIIANSAAGKGLLSLANSLPSAIDNYLKGENKRKKTTYERELQAWEQQSHSSGKGAKVETTGYIPRPEEPEYYHLCGSPNTSKNQLISRLKTNGPLGLIITATELDTISGAIKQDYGKHDDVFRAAFHHESVSTDFKTDKELIFADDPHLALCLSGTPEQLPSFIHSSTNGTYSRFTPYNCLVPWKYRSAAPIKGQENYHDLYKRLSAQVLDMFLIFQQSPTEVTLTDKQWEEHTAYFSEILDEVASERPNAPGGIVLRSALTVTRIACILTALRKFEGGMHMKEYICTDEDFHTAMEIVKTTMQHSLLLESSLPGNDVKGKPLRPYFRIGEIFNKLPTTFTLKEIKEKVLSNGISESSLYRFLNKMAKSKHIEKQDNTYHKLKMVTGKRE